MNSRTPPSMPGPAQVNVALLLIRIAGALAYLYHGSAILFGAFGGPGPQHFAASHHMADPIAYLVGLAQVAGGVGILTGILTRFSAACCAVIMLGAIFTVHLPHGFNVAEGGAEYALTQLFAAIALMVTGPGAFSLSTWLPAPLQKF